MNDAGEPGADAVPVPERDGRSARLPAIALGLVVSALFAWLAFRNVDAAGVWGALRRMSLPLLAAAVLIKGASFFALAFRSRITTAAVGPLPLSTLTAAHFVGYTGNNVLPFRLGEILRIQYLHQRTAAPRSLLLTTIVVERILDSMLLLTLFAATAPIVLGDREWGPGILLIVVGTGSALAAGVVMARTRLLPVLVARVARFWPIVGRIFERRVHQVVDGLASLSGIPQLLKAAGATVLYWGVGFCTLTVLLRAFHLDLPWWAPMVIIAMVAVGTALPSSPAYVGTYHYFAAWALGLIGVPPETAASFAIVSHAVAVGPYSLVGLVLFLPWIASWSSALVRTEELDDEADPVPS